MEDEDIAPNAYSLSNWYGQKVVPVPNSGKSLKYSVLTRLSAITDWISCMYLAHYPCLPFCVLFYIHLIILWGSSVNKMYSSKMTKMSSF